MTDAAIHGWFASHHLLAFALALAVLGSTGSLLATMAAKGDNQIAAWRKTHPVLAFFGDALRAAGVDLPKLVTLTGIAIALLLKLLSKKDDEP